MRSDKIIQGQVQFSINNGVTLEQCFKSFTDLGVSEYDLTNFYYSKIIPNDSMTYYFNILKSRSYISVFNIQKMTGDIFTRFNAIKFKNLTQNNFKQWDSIVKKEALIEMPDIGNGMRRNGIINIPIGEEKNWIKKLKQLPIIYSADYMYVYTPFD